MDTPNVHINKGFNNRSQLSKLDDLKMVRTAVSEADRLLDASLATR